MRAKTMNAKGRGMGGWPGFLCSSVTTVFMISASRALALQSAQRLVVNVPLFQDRENGLAAKPGARQLAENPRHLLLIFRFLQTLLAQVVPRLFFLVDALVCGLTRFLDHAPVHSSRLQLRDHAHATEFLIVPAQRGIRRGVL